MRSIIISLYLLLTLSATAQESVDQRVRKVSADAVKAKLKNIYIHPRWAEDLPYMYYHLDTPSGPVNYVVDLKSGKVSELIRDYDTFVSDFENLTGEKLPRARVRLYRLDFPSGSPDIFVATFKGKSIRYDRRNGKMSLVDPSRTKLLSQKKARGKLTSTDSRYTMVAEGADLALKDNHSGKVERITFDGDSYFSYTSSSDGKVKPKGFWVGDKYIALLKEEGKIHKMGLIRSLTKSRPKVITFNMSIPGDAAVPQYAIYYFDAQKKRGAMLDIDKYQDQEVVLAPFRCQKSLYFTRVNRKGDRIDLCRIDLGTGEVHELLSEECAPHYNQTLFDYRVFDQGKQILWWSERTGYGQYYLYDDKGNLIRRVTQGDGLVCGRLLWIDEKRKEIMFVGYGGEKGQHPQYAHHYLASLDGCRQRCVNPQDGHHEVEVSPDKRYALDKCSRMDMPPVYSIIDLHHPKSPAKIHEIPATEAKSAGWISPTLITVKADDGKTDLQGLMYLPSTLDKSKSYPIITYVYPGPQTDMMPLGFEVDENANQSLAETGFVVVQVPSRGSSPLRGHEFYNYGYGNLRDYPLADNKSAIEQLAKVYPFIDLDRVGIYGHSGGAFHAVTSLLTYPDFYKVAVAASGNYDNNIYIRWWGESFHGVTEEKDPETGKIKFVCKVPTPLELVHNLKGQLLLMTGDEDKNVPPSSTYRLADALIRADKHFDMFVFPGKDHQLESPYYFDKIRRYFVKHLLKTNSKKHNNNSIYSTQYDNEK
ncbi:prolyl oligopeptidase family serine peptidase [Porphyromonas sp.]|uniref:S9 family peptidase n=1 Tax=Porphyromonas sp. TaxID=1924944 RepID=UPI0026DDC58F|nr:prolyl oligopeptidase family serine peptidase [Porphyromonas sp.]MDO4771381.1 prolyl oligopeptidase family serine peptidase [Porphyromonas sp.]